MTFSLMIYSLDREVFAGNAVSLTVPGLDGEEQVLTHHAPLVSILKEGNVVVTDENNKRSEIPITGGVVEVTSKKVVALVDF